MRKLMLSMLLISSSLQAMQGKAKVKTPRPRGTKRAARKELTEDIKNCCNEMPVYAFFCMQYIALIVNDGYTSFGESLKECLPLSTSDRPRTD